MNKKMRELLNTIENKNAMAKEFLSGENKDVNRANALLDEVDSLKAEYEVEKRLFESEKDFDKTAESENKEAGQPQQATKKSMSDVERFAKAARYNFNRLLMPKDVTGALNEGTPASGGYTVPEDIQTMINEYKTAKFSLLNLVDVENVTTEKGARTFKKRKQQTGFTQVDEGGKIGAGAQPEFERLNYEIKKYAGYFPVTNELLADSDANIASVITNWIGDESRVTANNLILTKLKTFTSRTLEKGKVLDGLKSIINVDLGANFKNTSVIITNDNGLQYLDTLKDNEGRYLLTPNPTQPTQMQLACGATVIPVIVIGNDTLANDSTKIPFIVGDMKEAIKYFDRQQTTIMASDTATAGTLNAFEQDLTLFRAIEREDVQIKDNTAAFYATYDTVGE